MEKITFKNNTQPYLSAENLNQMQLNMENGIEDAKNNLQENFNTQLQTFDNNLINRTYPVGSVYYTTSTNFNPGNTFGGEWELVRTFYGGELIAFGNGYNTGMQANIVLKDVSLSFSDAKIPNKAFEITNYIDGIIDYNTTVQNGSFWIQPKGIAGMIKAVFTISGLGGSGCVGMWFHGNSNPLPTGVSLLRTYENIISGPPSGNYGGCSQEYIYKISDEASVDANFFVNPTASPYGGSFAPAQAGTKCSLQIQVFSKSGINYMWKRIS